MSLSESQPFCCLLCGVSVPLIPLLYFYSAVYLTHAPARLTTPLSECLAMQFRFNTALTEGGAIYVSAGSLNVTDCTFRSNAVRSTSLNSNGVGGAVASSSSTTSVHRSFFTNNSVNSPVAGYGGAIGVVGNINLTDNRFTQNRALHGGAVSLTDGAHTVNRCNFTENQAADTANMDSVPPTGGALFVTTVTSNQLTAVVASSFVSNSAERGGGVAVDLSATVTQSHSTMTLRVHCILLLCIPLHCSLLHCSLLLCVVPLPSSFNPVLCCLPGYLHLRHLLCCDVLSSW